LSNRDDAIGYLLGLSDGDLLDVLQRVFARRTPNPEEAAYNRNAYFLGAASQLREDDLDIDADPQLHRWGEWRIQAIAYLDRTHYPHGHADDCGFCEGGTCMVCKTDVRSYAKHGICPVCGNKVYMT
jgi:hypothetical protein